MKFRILGPLEILDGSERLELGGARQQIVLATLLLSANRVVTMDRLLEAIYGEDLPPTSRSQAQITISSLRRLFASHSPETVISTHAHGYVLQVDGGQLDSRRFEELVAAARAAREAGHLDQAVASYRDALRLWRGPALDGIDSQLDPGGGQPAGRAAHRHQRRPRSRSNSSLAAEQRSCAFMKEGIHPQDDHLRRVLMDLHGFEAYDKVQVPHLDAFVNTSF